MAGITSACVLYEPGGPNARTEWHCSTASSTLASSRSRQRSRRPRMIRPGLGPATSRRRSCHRLAHLAPLALRSRLALGRRARTSRPPARTGPHTTRTRAAYMPTGPGSMPRTVGGHACAGSLSVPGRCHRTPASSSAGRGRKWWAPKRTAATWPTAHTSSPAASRTAPMVSQTASVAGCSAYGWRRSRHILTAPVRLSVTVGVAAGAQEGVVLVEVGGDQAPQGGGAAPVVGAGLAPVAVLAAAGAPAAAVGVELVEWLGGP